MKTSLATHRRIIQRVACVAMAVLMVVAVSPIFQPGKASASAQLTSRSIQLSDSGQSGTTITSGVGSGTLVTYRVSFTTTQAANSLVIDFCSNSPIIADTCTAPTGLVTTGAAVGTVASGGNITSAGWTATTPSASQVKVAKASGAATSVGAQVFDLSTITNPSTLGSFYARIYTYTTTTFGTYTSAAVPGNYLDYGGIALSTSNVITISARVQETLTFCVTAADPNTWVTGTAGDCAATEVGASPPALTLGHGGPPKILDQTVVDFGNVWSQLSTNATRGAVVNMRSNPGGSATNATCGGLSANGGTTCGIPPVNAGAATAAAIVAGTAAFGMHCTTYAPTTNPGTVGSLTPTTPYNNGTNVSAGNSTGNTPASTVAYGMDNTTATAASGGLFASYNGSVSGVFGSTVASTTAPVYRADNRFTYAATAALTTPAGIYTANISMIATGTF